jgi:hypothetical protein
MTLYGPYENQRELTARTDKKCVGQDPRVRAQQDSEPRPNSSGHATIVLWIAKTDQYSVSMDVR